MKCHIPLFINGTEVTMLLLCFYVSASLDILSFITREKVLLAKATSQTRLQLKIPFFLQMY